MVFSGGSRSRTRGRVALVAALVASFSVAGCSAPAPVAAPVPTPSASRTETPPLSAPDELRVAPTSSGATVDWAPPQLSGSLPLSGYRLTVDTGAPVTLDPGTTFYTITGLTPGSRHVVRLWAFSPAGEGPKTSSTFTVSAAVPTPTPTPTPRPTSASPTPTASASASASPSPTPTPTPTVYVAPKTTGFTFLGCTAIPGTSNFQRDYRVVLSGGAFWYSGKQTAPSATLTIRQVNSSASTWIRSVTVSVGTPSAPTGKTAVVPLATPYASNC